MTILKRKTCARTSLLLTGMMTAAFVASSPALAAGNSAGDRAGDAAPDQAQPQATEPTGQVGVFGDIIVTANKRSEKLQNVGISAAAFSGETINRLGFHSATEMTKITPALNINYINPSASTLSIRGVSQNDFADHLEPPVAVYSDESYIGTSGANAVPMFDQARVEVLRGPQGTLFGRNATGGLLHFISAEPTERTSGYAQASYSSFNTLNLDGAISGKLAEGVLGRLSFARNTSDGPFTNIVTGRHDAGDTKNWAMRAQLVFEISSATKLRLIGKYYNDDQHGPMYPFEATTSGANGLGVLVGANQVATYPNIVVGGTITACAGCNVLGYKDADGSPWTSASNKPGYFKRNIYGGQAKLTHDLGGVTLTAISDYLAVIKHSSNSVDMSPTPFFIYSVDQNYKQFSQELRLNGDKGALKWVAGLYYLNMRGNYGQPLDVNFGPYLGVSSAWSHFEPRYSLNVDSVAAFAQGELALSDKLSATLGARFTHDNKRFDYAWSATQAWNPVLFYKDRANFDNVALKAQLDYRPAPSTLLYASYTRGHKGGNWAAPAFPPINTAVMPHKQEVLNSLEAGAKIKLLGNLATFNISAYHYIYNNYQAFSLQNLTQAIYNKDALVTGGEAELRLTPMRGLDVSVSGALIDSKVKAVGMPDGSTLDRKLPNAPSFQATGLIRYAWPLAGGQMAAQASGKYMGSHYLTVLNEPVNHQKAYGTLDARLSWESTDGRLEIAAFGRNITGSIYRVYSLDVSPLSLAINILGERATYGASVRVKY